MTPNLDRLAKDGVFFQNVCANIKAHGFDHVSRAYAGNPLDSMKIDPRSTPVGILDEAPKGLPSRESVFARVRASDYPERTAPDTWLDDNISALLTKLEEHKIADNTLVIYFNDHSMEHNSKASLYQGALRTPMMAWWPGTIPPGINTDLVSSIDFGATILGACGVQPPADMPIDGLNFLPLITGEKTQWRNAIYGEIGFTRAVVTRDWK